MSLGILLLLGSFGVLGSAVYQTIKRHEVRILKKGLKFFGGMFASSLLIIGLSADASNQEKPQAVMEKAKIETRTTQESVDPVEAIEKTAKKKAVKKAQKLTDKLAEKQEAAEQQRLATEKAEQEKVEQEKHEREQAEQEKHEREQAEQAKIVAQEAEAERQKTLAAAQAAEQEKQEAVNYEIQAAFATEQTVFVAPQSGKKYHFNQNCRGLSNANSVISLSLSEAELSYSLCGWE